MITDIYLSAFLREPIFYEEYGDVVDISMFEDSASKAIIGTYIKYTEKYKKIPSQEEMYSSLESYTNYFKINDTVKQQAIEKLQTCYSLSYDLDYARDNFIRFATVSKLTRSIIDAAKIIKDKGEGLSEKELDSIQESITESLSIQTRTPEGVLLSDVADNPSDFVSEQNRYDPSTVVPTGFASLDRSHIAGGILPGELCVISAPPGRGKSTFLVNIGAAAAFKGKDVIHIFVGDNTNADGVLRYCSRMTSVPMSQIMLNSQKYFDMWSKLKETIDIGDIVIGSYPIKGATVNDIRAFITKQITSRKLQPKVVIIDYINNCRYDTSKSSYDGVGDLYMDLKNLAEELELVIWTASQPKIEFWDDMDPGLSSLAESSKIQHIIDLLVTSKKLNATQNELLVPKMRRGRSDFKFTVSIDYERMWMKESFSTAQQSSGGDSQPQQVTGVTVVS